MLKIVERFDKHSIFQFQGERVVAGRFWKLICIRRAAGGELDPTVLAGGATALSLEQSGAAWF
jgi:hypothetical protein